ncbi:MAG TPA: patatin-like phospholipase family protein, partial [Pseudomonadales bacterium]|nr:patatin-like phospholipase family protein [Pseudomonadales bacterium]
ATLTPGWFDKPFRRRRIAATSVDDLLLICPSPAFVASLPGGKVPDRADPRRLGRAGCQRAWHGAGEASRRLGEALAEVLDGDRVPELIGAA